MTHTRVDLNGHLTVGTNEVIPGMHITDTDLEHTIRFSDIAQSGFYIRSNKK